MNALPFSTLEKSLKRLIPGYPEEPSTIAEYLKKKRFDLKLSQERVAKILHVSPAAISNWETGIKAPRINHRANVIAFLGFNPWNSPVETFAGRLRHYRNERGLTQSELAKMLETDAATISDWELGNKKPAPKSIKKLKQLDFIV